MERIALTGERSALLSSRSSPSRAWVHPEPVLSTTFIATSGVPASRVPHAGLLGYERRNFHMIEGNFTAGTGQNPRDLCAFGAPCGEAWGGVF